MHAVMGALGRRAMEVHRHMGNKPDFVMPAWGSALVIITFIFFLMNLSMIEYTFTRLIPTLAMVESPEAILVEALPSEDPDAPLGGNRKVQPELLLIKQAPITSSLRKTIKHLRSKAGCMSRFRGFSVFLVHGFLVQYIAQFASAFPFIPTSTARVLAALICAQLSMAWTHIVISDPSPKRWFRRVPPFSSWKKIAGPTAVLAIAEQLTIVLTARLASAYGFANMSPEDAKNLSPAAARVLVVKALSTLVLFGTLAFLIVLPANVTLTRVQASLLADTEETIIPFDRTFGSKVVPEIVGGSGVVSLVDAWKTFDWNARVRLFKAYAKGVAMQIAVIVLFSLTIFCQVYFIVEVNPKKTNPV